MLAPYSEDSFLYKQVPPKVLFKRQQRVNIRKVVAAQPPIKSASAPNPVASEMRQFFQTVQDKEEIKRPSEIAKRDSALGLHYLLPRVTWIFSRWHQARSTIQGMCRWNKERLHEARGCVKPAALQLLLDLLGSSESRYLPDRVPIASKPWNGRASWFNPSLTSSIQVWNSEICKFENE